MARRELDDLARQVDQEIARANTNAAQQAGGRANQQSSGEQTGGRGNDPSKTPAGQASNESQPNQDGQQSAAGGGKEPGDQSGQASAQAGGQPAARQNGMTKSPSQQARGKQANKGRAGNRQSR
jgi:hypothetical protein